MMLDIRGKFGLLALGGAFVLAISGQTALAQKKVIVAAGESAGGVVNAAISGIAKVVTQKTSTLVR